MKTEYLHKTKATEIIIVIIITTMIQWNIDRPNNLKQQNVWIYNSSPKGEIYIF